MGFPVSPHHLWETQLISGPSLLGLLGLLFFLTLFLPSVGLVFPAQG